LTWKHTDYMPHQLSTLRSPLELPPPVLERNPITGKICEVLPVNVIDQLRKLKWWRKVSLAKKEFIDADCILPSYLDAQLIPELHEEYLANKSLSYDNNSVVDRARTRVHELTALLGNDFQKIHNVLEIGCGDGILCSQLSSICGKNCTALDITATGQHPYANKKEVNFIIADAAQLPLPDDSFELVFSYNSFEHIKNPGKAFHEALRVCRPGGFIFLSFNPLFCAPNGYHAYWSTSIPYVQFLFDQDDLNSYLIENGLPGLEDNEKNLNKWSLNDFRELWRLSSGYYDLLHYKEIPDYHGLDLIITYPACFKSKGYQFDDYLISGIEMLIMKK
jgi:ubiquinone/menaquinone biosynthesis C-methylase UbiE